jgi:hypothetical protein
VAALQMHDPRRAAQYLPQEVTFRAGELATWTAR